MSRIVSVLLLLALWPAALSAETPSQNPRVWRVGVESSSAPYTFKNDRGQPDGFSVELMRATAEAQRLQVEFVMLDWPQLLEEFRAGRIDVISNIATTPERRSFAEFSTSTVAMHGGVFRRADLGPLKKLADLEGLRVATQREGRSAEYIREHNIGVTSVYVDNLVESIQALADGRADVLFATDLVTRKIIRERHFSQVVPAEVTLPDFEYRLHFAVTKGNTDLLAQINEGLSNTLKSGTYDRLYEKWLGQLDRRPLRVRDLQPYLFPLAGVALVAVTALVWQRTLLRRVSSQAREIRENEERLRLVFEGSRDGFWDWDASKGRILRSPRWASMLGYTLEEIGPQREGFINLIHPDDRPMMAEDYQQVLNGKDHFNLEFRMRAKNGEWKWIMDRGKVISRDPTTKALLRVTGTHTDITARKLADEQAARLESKMQETQKLESLGVLAGGIAHDFNNLLTVILGNSMLARMDSDVGSINRERLDAVVNSAQRAAELCHQLLAYAGRASYSIQHVNLNDIVTETTQLIAMSIGRNATLRFALAENLPPIEADAAQLRQVVLNLVTNAIEALSGKPGQIDISTQLVALLVSENESLPPIPDPIGNCVALVVKDNGCGMAPEVLTRIFDPFFSTKFTGRGLGLAAVQGIARAHRGSVKVQSVPGKGSTFTVLLPAGRKNPDAPAGVQTTFPTTLI